MEEIREAEDWCFVCKDGGDLILCDNGNCSKVYHLECVGFEDQTTSQIQQNWTCDWHSCASCKGPASELQCFCCPTSFCKNCLTSVKFLPLRPNKGLCTDCWTLARLAENLSFSKKYVDFEDRDTHECLFKEYWEIVKQEQGLSRDDLLVACSSRGRKRKIMKESTITTATTTTTTNSKSNYNAQPQLSSSWGSKPLIEFLSSIGVDTTNQQLSQHDVSSIILKYVQEKDLMHSIKKNKVICDRNLHLIFKKNTLPIKHIDLLLRPHFSHNANNNTTCFVANYKQQKTLLSCCSEEIKSPKKDQKAAHFASVVAHNIKLVYLRKSLVEELLKQPQSFEDKLVGSFVKVVKTDSSQELHSSSKGKISRQLLQVTAVKKMSSRSDGRNNIVLHVRTLPDIIQISMLSDSDITEEDCQELKEKMANGLLQRPTVEEIENKARILLQDIRKNWMERELVNLQNLIDRANEKGRRKELYQLIEQRQILKKEAEQQPLLLKQQLPTVMADSAETKADEVFIEAENEAAADVDVEADANGRKNWIESELVNLQNLIDRANEKGRRNELYQLIEQRQTLKKEAEQQQQQTLVLKQQLPNVIAQTHPS